MGQLDTLDQFADDGLRPDAGDFYPKGASQQHGSCIHQVTRTANHRHTLSGDRSLVDCGLPGLDDSIDGDLVARARDDRRSAMHLFRTHGDFDIAHDYPDVLFRRQQVANRGARAAERQHLEVFAEIQQPDHDEGSHALFQGDARDGGGSDQSARGDLPAAGHGLEDGPQKIEAGNDRTGY